MTITQIANTAGCSRDTVKRLVKTMYPEVKAPRRGVALELNEDQCINVMDKLPKKNYVGLPSANTPTNIEQNNHVDYEAIGKMIAIAVSSALQPLVNEIKEIKQERTNDLLLPAPQIGDREQLTKLVREYATNKLDGDFQQAYRELYSQILYRLKTNVKVKAKNEGISRMDYIEREGLLQTCISIMIELSV